jgi:hypothetical protein
MITSHRQTASLARPVRPRSQCRVLLVVCGVLAMLLVGVVLTAPAIAHVARGDTTLAGMPGLAAAPDGDGAAGGLAATGAEVAEDYRLLARAVFRVLGFDRHLEARCEFGAVRLVIVRGGDVRAIREATAIGRAFEELRGTTIAGMPYEYQITDAVPKQQTFEVIILPSGLPPRMVRECLDDSRQRGILCLTTDLSYVRSGAAVAIIVGSGRPEIVIQRTHAREQGAEFDPRLFTHSTVICD